MAGEQGIEGTGITNPTQSVIEKGKGKAVDTPQDVSMGEDSDSSDEETGAEEDEPEQADEDEEEDDLQEIDTDNIVGGRTRGKSIDYNKVDPADLADLPDDDDDEDYEDDNANKDAMEE